MMGSYTEKSEQALTKMLQDIPLWGFDSVDSDALTEAARKVQENVTWRKVAPYFAEAFIETLRVYFERFRYGVAYPRDFMDVAEEVSGQDLDALYEEWIAGKEAQ